MLQAGFCLAPPRAWALLAQSLKQMLPKFFFSSDGFHGSCWLAQVQSTLSQELGHFRHQSNNISVAGLRGDEVKSPEAWTDCEEVPGVGPMMTDMQAELPRQLLRADLTLHAGVRVGSRRDMACTSKWKVLRIPICHVGGQRC